MIRKQGMMTWKVMAGAMMIGSAVGAAPAAVTWTGGGGNANWTTVGNWNTGVPTSTDDVIIGSAFTSGSPNVGGSSGSPVVVQSLTTFNTTAANVAVGGNGFLQLTSGSSVTGSVSSTKKVSLQLNTLTLPSTNAWVINANTVELQINNITGASTITKTGAGTIQFTNSLTYAGNWDYIGNISQFSAGAFGQGIFTWRGGAWGFGGSYAIANTINFASTSNTFIGGASGAITTTYSNGFTGNLGGGSIFFNHDGGNKNDGATVVLAGTNTMNTTGGTNNFIIGAGTLRLDSTDRLVNIATVSVGRDSGAHGILAWNVAGDTVSSSTKFLQRASLVGYHELKMNVAGTTTVNGQYSLNNGGFADGGDLRVTAVTGGTLVLAGYVTDVKNTAGTVIASSTNRSITKLGLGTLTLSGNTNDYRGGTTVSAGTLLVNNTTGSATGTGAVSVANGATLGGSGFISGPVTFVDNATLAPGNSPGTLTVGGLTLANASVLDFELDALDHTVGGGVNDLVQVNGNLTLDGILNISVLNGASLSNGIYRLFNYTGTVTDNGVAAGTGFPPFSSVQVDTNNKQVNLVVIPEPATLGLLALGGLMIATRRSK